MILTPHFLVGAVLMENIGYIPIALPLILLSHYLLDTIPHWDYSTDNIKKKRWRNSIFEFAKVSADLGTAAIIVFVFADNQLLALLGGTTAVLPDAITFFTIILGRNKLLASHLYFHHNIIHWFHDKKVATTWKLLPQIILALGCIFLLIS